MKVFPTIPDKDIRIFLKELCQLSIDDGAENANDIEVSNIKFTGVDLDCPDNEQSFYYPKVLYKKDPIQDVLTEFQNAIVFSINNEHGLKKVYEITAKVESHCFYKNYHLAVGLAAGNCRNIFCSTRNSCQAMTIGKGCAFPMIARPSIEACNIDLELLAKESQILDFNKDKTLLGMVFVN